MITELERTGFRGALSLRCRDAVRGTVIADGLVATARPHPTAPPRIAARSPLSGLLGFGTLPGVVQHTRSTGGAAPLTWPAPTATAWLINVVDTQRRYLPVLASIDVPAGAPADIDLHSAVVRQPQSGWAVVRGEVHDRDTGQPLPWPMVTITAATTAYPVVGDDQGRFLLIAPYPEALPPLSGSPPAGPGLGAMTWPLTLAVRSEPTNLDFAGTPGVDPPEIGSILAQREARTDVNGTLQQSSTAVLDFGLPTFLILSVETA